MWKLNNISVKNLCAFKELEYTPAQGVTTLIFGDNRDNESQRSNGSGKSALIESIAVGLTGSPLRKIKSEEIINDSAQQCSVTLELHNNSSNEVFIIERNIFRKGASTVRCQIILDGVEVETDEAVQHSVDAYNKYILEKIGITRSELFNNFLLSKHRYEDFLSASDKDKKEIINRFSNGIVVDDAITRIEKDIEPVQAEMREQELEFASIEGRIEMLHEQITTQESSKHENQRQKEERIEQINQSIVTKRSEIRGIKEKITELENSKTEISKLDKDIAAIEESQEPIEVLLEKLNTMLSGYGTTTNWTEVIEQNKGQLSNAEKKLTSIKERHIKAQKSLLAIESQHKELQHSHELFIQKTGKSNDGFDSDMQKLIDNLNRLSASAKELQNKRHNIAINIQALKTKLAGTINCPKCNFEFLATDESFDVITAQRSVSEQEGELTSINTEITNSQKEVAAIEEEQEKITISRRIINAELQQWQEKLALSNKELQAAGFSLENIETEQTQISQTIATIQNQNENLKHKVFDEVFELIDNLYVVNQRDVKRHQENIAMLNSSIDTLESTKQEIEKSSLDDVLNSLKSSIKEYREKSSRALDRCEKTKQQLSLLQNQQQWFMDFKSYIANTKVEALSKITNEFLESIGSDIRINFSGYTRLKNGKIREKISVSLVRDGVDCGSFGKFSEGEKARVNLSTILAMQKLINSNCDSDKGLDLLVLDEILAAVDEQGNTMMFESLNRLKLTAIVVSHGYISENYPYALTITKENGESKIS